MLLYSNLSVAALTDCQCHSDCSAVLAVVTWRDLYSTCWQVSTDRIDRMLRRIAKLPMHVLQLEQEPQHLLIARLEAGKEVPPNLRAGRSSCVQPLHMCLPPLSFACYGSMPQQQQYDVAAYYGPHTRLRGCLTVMTGCLHSLQANAEHSSCSQPDNRLAL